MRWDGLRFLPVSFVHVMGRVSLKFVYLWVLFLNPVVMKGGI